MTTPVVALGIDQGKRSGFALVSPRGRVIQIGIATTWRRRAKVLDDAAWHAHGLGVPIVAVLEDHSEIPMSRGRNTSTILGLGEARGRWREALERAAIPSVSVSPRVWRAAVLGPAVNRAPRASVKRAAVSWALGMLRDQDGVGALDEDSAEALAIAWWGLHAPQAWAAAGSLLDAMARSRPAGAEPLR